MNKVMFIVEQCRVAIAYAFWLPHGIGWISNRPPTTNIMFRCAVAVDIDEVLTLLKESFP